MFISRIVNAGLRPSTIIRIGIIVGLFVTALLSVPFGSGAKPAAPQTSTSQKKQRPPRFVPGDVIIRYRDESLAQRKVGTSALMTADGSTVQMRVESFAGSTIVPGLRIARVAAGDTMKAIEALRHHPDVLYAEPNYILRSNITTPNDTNFNSHQWNLVKIGALQAWDTTQGSSNVVVAILDQGIDVNHLDLQPNIWINPAPGALPPPPPPNPPITGDVNGYNFVDNNGMVFSDADTENHASHVAGIAGAVGNNAKGIAGVNWTVRLMSLKFLDENGNGSTIDAIRGCTYAKQMRDLWISSGNAQGANVRVINASFGGGGFSQSFLDVINQLNTSGVLFVAAAGNIDDGTREPNNDLVPHYPSSFKSPNIIAAASTNQSDALASFSHFGATSVDLGAPGVSVLSTTPDCAMPGPNTCQPEAALTDPNGDTYSVFSGTSMSAPHVAGSAALLWARNPNLTVRQVKDLLVLNGDVVPAVLDKTLTGRRLNIANSMQSLLENDVTAPGPVTNFHINSQNGRNFSLGWTASGDDGATGRAALYELSFTDGTSGAVTVLKGVVPMSSSLGQITDVVLPFRHTGGMITLREFDNVGNEGTPQTLAVGIPLSAGDPYTTSTSASPALTTNTLPHLNLNADDVYAPFILPAGFTFPFFGEQRTELILSSNGAIYFSAPPERENGDADDPPGSPGAVGGQKMIAGLWEDLDLRTSVRADAGIYVSTPNANTIIFRWQAKPCAFDGNVCTGGADVNFEIELRTDGTIKTRYGSGNTMLFPTVGIGGGNHDAYIITSHTSEEAEINLTNAAEVTFTPRAQTVSTIQLSQPTFNATESSGVMNIGVTRSGDTSSVALISFASSDTGSGNSCPTMSGQASARCDYLRTVGTMVFAMGETSKTISIPLVDDVFAEGPETFTFTISNPVGATLGAQVSATLTITDAPTPATTNPIDGAEFFVRMHYIDFLNRQPDPAGLAFWRDGITSCGANAQCVEVKRIDTSAAFFLSIEFQETGYLVYRMYKAGLGNSPGTPVPVRFADFLRDTQEIRKGVEVGIGNWVQQLEANKQTFALAFVQRPEFQAAFSNSMTAAQFVDKLNTNAGGALSATERTNLIATLTIPSDLSQRAAVLRAVAEDQTLRDAEFNKAFVLLQYFGYLRRNPDDLPDSNFAGWQFWLDKLNQFNGDFRAAEMVKAFISSIEYRQRFGQ